MLRFALGPIPVRIHLSFLLLALLAWSAGFSGGQVAIWTGVALVSILGHELGHAVTARRYRAEAAITLYALGGVTRIVPTRPLTGRQRFWVSAAGSLVEVAPAVGLLLAGRSGVFGSSVAAVLSAPFGDMIGLAALLGEPVAFAVATFVWVSLVWGVFNWLPIRGLDGYQMLGRILEARLTRAGAAATLRVVAVATGATVAFLAWRAGLRFAALFVIILTVSDVFPRAVGSMADR